MSVILGLTVIIAAAEDHGNRPEASTATPQPPAASQPSQPSAPPARGPHFDTRDPDATRFDWLMERWCAELGAKYDWSRQMCRDVEPPT